MKREDNLDAHLVDDEISTPSHTRLFDRPILVLALVTGSIFIAEFLIMFLLRYLHPMSTLSEALLDSVILIVLILPLLYLFVLRPLRSHLRERKILESKLREASITDELTGLLNRRGFRILSEQQCKVAIRNKRGISLLFADLDNMKSINDKFGHAEGDRALMNTAGILKASFREADIIGRIGGDEFAVFLSNDSKPDSANTMMKHVLGNLNSFNKQNQQKYRLSLSMGVAHEDPEHSCPIDKLMSQADKLMYEQKRHRQAS